MEGEPRPGLDESRHARCGPSDLGSKKSRWWTVLRVTEGSAASDDVDRPAAEGGRRCAGGKSRQVKATGIHSEFKIFFGAPRRIIASGRRRPLAGNLPPGKVPDYFFEPSIRVNDRAGASLFASDVPEDKRQYTGDIVVNAAGGIVCAAQIFAGKIDALLLLPAVQA
jgi:hypothetical protein